jgi:mono/diheme cytochrome c family protein
MKSRYFFVLMLMAGLVFTGLAGRNTNPSPRSTEMKGDSTSLPPEIFSIVKNSCLACHGTGGKAMALAHLKLSEWDAYSSEKKANKAADMCKMVSGHKMPPKGFLKSNPEKAPTQAQIDAICAWSKELNK